MDQSKIALGLSDKSSNEEIVRSIFNFTSELGYMIMATIALDGKPTSRGIEVHYLDDEGNLYIGMSCGKPFYEELKRNPYFSGNIVHFPDGGKLALSIRINAYVEEISDPRIYDRYWKQNQGTKSLYRKALENFRIFKLTKGEGELFHIYEDDRLVRLRFSFGGSEPRAWHYTINEKCTGCGECVLPCMMDVISISDQKADIDHTSCLECGVCFSCCPFEAIDKNC